ncbi:hypothetical protein BDV28DRAFT_162388 [Aspergillus coremiiformis]|uniref:Uncharacterized protein n=1 Tax=Aspergillus coremiiformis TaxID=138285 RepID=A0A5N6ZDS6_9EURO|nr:hypothetical protein BDV28DRAFT_162388 [Aspergillus coremiiformis]
MGSFARSADHVASSDPEQFSKDIDSGAKPISPNRREENPDLQLDRERFSDGKVQEVQEFDKSSDFTATDSDKNVTANTSQESPDTRASSLKGEMIRCSDDKQRKALERKNIRTEAINFIRARTQARLARMEASSEGVLSSQTTEQFPSPNIPIEPNIAPTETMEPALASKKKKKKKGKKKSKKQVPLDVEKAGSFNNQEFIQAGPSDYVPRVQPLDEGAGITDSPAYLSRSEEPLEPSPSPSTHPAPFKSEHSTYTTQDMGFVVPHVTQDKNDPQVKEKITTQALGSSTECRLDIEDCERTYRDVLLGISDSKGKKRVSRVDPTTGDEITEHNATFHAHPSLLTTEEWPRIKEETLAETEPHASPEASSSVSPGKDEEQSSTGSPTGAQSTRLGPSTRKSSKIPLRDKLPPIQEVSSWASAEPQGTPQTESSEIETTGTGHCHQKISINTRPVATSETRGSHAHPSSSVSIEKHGWSATQKCISTLKPEGFFWQLDSHGFPCAKVGCEKRCNLWDGATVICPRCGPFSEIRYCSEEHLVEDIKWHWLYCGQMTFEHPCRENSIPRDVKHGPPLVPCLHPYDTPERHRQAVYFNAKAGGGDYFIFSDWADLVEAGLPTNNSEVGCSSRVVYTIKFDDTNEKDRFRRVLATCLFMTIEVTELVDYLFRLIRDKLRSEAAPMELDNALTYQFHEEFRVTIQPHITGNRHACMTDWDGRNRRHCQDTVCRREYSRVLGSLGGKGHRQLIDHLEGSYWILRAARTTHPSVTDANARMRGEGFSDVADEDRREFRRGAGWDGAGTGDMEIEGINDD